ncbi:MAG: hypothetical protein MI810_12355 [Flavobacteriales bacterium]|nr:hypothetical protein [Flavobacteriales bacterium]
MEFKLIILVVIVLAAIAVAQLMKLHSLNSKVTGRREEDIDLRVNNLNATLMLVFLTIFFGSLIYMVATYGKGMLPEPASEHGVDVEWLFDINWIIVFAVFLSCNFLLFWFAFKYRYHPDRKAYFFAHNNKLELIWTTIPASALAIIIILGLMTWNDITGKPSDDAKVIEIYAKQFDWTARYSGDDNKLGYSDYKLVSTSADNPNALGVITKKNIDWRIYELDNEVNSLREKLHNDSAATETYSAANLYKMEKTMEKLDRIKERVSLMREMYSGENDVDELAADDFIAKELFLVKDQEYFFVFRSQDVIHCAYFPHFRTQMNCVPGMRTSLKFKPIYTTAEMREKTKNPDFNYILLCNKICGVSHSNMKMSVTVGTQEEFDAWKDLEAGNATMAVADSEEPPHIDVELNYYGEHDGGHGHGEGDSHGEEEGHDDHNEGGDHH